MGTALDHAAHAAHRSKVGEVGAAAAEVRHALQGHRAGGDRGAVVLVEIRVVLHDPHFRQRRSNRAGVREQGQRRTSQHVQGVARIAQRGAAQQGELAGGNIKVTHANVAEGVHADFAHALFGELESTTSEGQRTKKVIANGAADGRRAGEGDVGADAIVYQRRSAVDDGADAAVGAAADDGEVFVREIDAVEIEHAQGADDGAAVGGAERLDVVQLHVGVRDRDDVGELVRAAQHRPAPQVGDD